MSLDVSFKARKNVICPHCNGVVGTEVVVDCVCSGGRGWYDILEQIGYYVPFDQRTEENDWYGKDMTLTLEQSKQVYDFVKKHLDLYNATNILGLIATTMADGNEVVVNANW